MLCVKNVGILFVVVAIKVSEAEAVLPYDCHMQKDSPKDLQDGVLGETGTFPWLGLLKVYMRDQGSIITALTGIVMVTHRYALVSVDDVAKMPSKIFHKSTKAMFIPVTGKPLYYRLLNYTAHPEYKNPTMNTFGLITLAPHAQGAKFPDPVCWNQEPFNNLDQLYVVGFSDEYELVEKFIHKAEPIDLDTCNYFYIDEGLNEVKRMPIHYQCASTVILKKTCVWDTGMALVSNSTGYWVLVGFGVYGPGCSVPARFIELLPYEQWMQSVVGPQISFTRGGRNRRRQHELIEEYKMNYPFDTESYSKSNAFYNINRISAQKAIISINSKTKNTTDCVDLIYSEKSKIMTPFDIASRKLKIATYKLSLYDLLYENTPCIEISLAAECQKNAYLYIEDSIKHTDGAALTDWDMPKELLQGYLNTANKHPHKRPAFIEHPNDIEFITNYNLFMRFQFEGEACFVIKVYGRFSNPQMMKTHNNYIYFSHISRGYPYWVKVRVLKRYQWGYRWEDGWAYRYWGALGTGRGYSKITAPISVEMAANVGSFSASFYASYLSAIITSELGLHAHYIHGNDSHYKDNFMTQSVKNKLRNFNFDFNKNRIEKRIHQLAAEANSRGETVKTTSFTVNGTGYANGRCEFGHNCGHRYKGYVGHIPISTTTYVQVTVNTRPTFTTTKAVTVTESFINYMTSPFGEIQIPYITEYDQWCFFLNMKKETYCYRGEDGYDDDNLPPGLWSKTPTP